MINLILYIDIAKNNEEVYIMKVKNNKVDISKEYSVLTANGLPQIKEILRKTIIEKLAKLFSKNEIIIKGNVIGMNENGNK